MAMRRRGSKAANPSTETQQSQQIFDPLQFRIRAKDEAGHYEKIQTQVPPELDVEVKSIANSGMFDFDGVGGFVRWSIVNGIEFLKGYRSEYPSQISIIRAISLENARSEIRREFKRSIDETAKEAFELNGMGYPQEAAKHVHRILSEIRRLDPNDPWRAIYLNEIKQKFGYLLRSGKAASLVPVLEEEDREELQSYNLM